jgi:hypothetical protein
VFLLKSRVLTSHKRPYILPTDSESSHRHHLLLTRQAKCRPLQLRYMAFLFCFGTSSCLSITLKIFPGFLSQNSPRLLRFFSCITCSNRVLRKAERIPRRIQAANRYLELSQGNLVSQCKGIPRIVLAMCGVGGKFPEDLRCGNGCYQLVTASVKELGNLSHPVIANLYILFLKVKENFCG